MILKVKLEEEKNKGNSVAVFKKGFKGSDVLFTKILVGRLQFLQFKGLDLILSSESGLSEVLDVYRYI